jgi:FkbM family methyltransferase
VRTLLLSFVSIFNTSGVWYDRSSFSAAGESGFMFLDFLKKTPFYPIYHRYNLLTQKSLSQQGQDYWVINEVFNLKKNGYFVEIGSTDGVSINNTYLLEKIYGWNGICIEPNPEYFVILEKTRNVTCLNVCVDQSYGKVDFFLEKLHGGIVESHHIRSLTTRKETVKDQVVTIETFPLVDLLRQHKAPKVIDYLSIDVEGAETRILNQFPFDEYTFICMTVELPSQELQNTLQNNGYVCIKIIPGLDYCYIHQSFIEKYSSNLHRFYKTNALGDRLNNWSRLLTT